MAWRTRAAWRWATRWRGRREIVKASGGALVARGLAKGPDVARTLKRIEARWVAAGFPPAVPDDWIAQELAEAMNANAASGSSGREKWNP